MPATKIVAGVGGGGWICTCVDAGHEEECVYTAANILRFRDRDKRDVRLGCPREI
jgi:hypothetical protein